MELIHDITDELSEKNMPGIRRILLKKLANEISNAEKKL